MPVKRRELHLSPDEFWESNELQKFRLFYSNLSECRRFRRWLRRECDKYIDNPNEKTFDEIVNEKYGEDDDYSDYWKIRENPKALTFHDFSPQFFSNEQPNPLLLREEISNI